MIVELTGPAASGKTTFAAELARSDPDVRVLPSSPLQVMRRPRLPMFYQVLRLLVRGLTSGRLLLARGYWRRARQLHKSASGALRTTLRLIYLRLVCHGAMPEEAVFVLDEGLYQWRNWLDSSEIEDLSILNHRRVLLPSLDVLVVVDPCPRLALRRALERDGDHFVAAAARRAPGDLSALGIRERDREDAPRKVRAARHLGAAVVYVLADEVTPAVSVYPPALLESRQDSLREARISLATRIASHIRHTCL